MRVIAGDGTKRGTDMADIIITGTSGADNINNNGVPYATIDAGAGDDNITNSDISHWASINAGTDRERLNPSQRLFVVGNQYHGRHSSRRGNYHDQSNCPQSSQRHEWRR